MEERWQTTLKECRPHREWLDTLAARFTTRLPDELRPAQEYDTLTELIHQVGCPGLMADDPNEPHRVLASLNLPPYLTINKSVWDLHQTVIKQTMENRVTMIKTVGDAAASALKVLRVAGG